MVLRRTSLVDGRAGARVLGDSDVAAALRVCALDPVGSVLAAARLEHAATSGVRGAGGALWGFESDGRLRAICWAGANMVPVVPTDEAAVRAVRDEIDRIVGRIEPTLVIVSSVIVGIILLSVMLPLMGIMTTIG